MLNNVADIFPLTGMQQMMLVRTMRDPRSSLFVEQLSAAIAGQLDLPMMRQAWQRAADLHPALRTAIVWQGLDRPLQVVRDRIELPLTEHDLRQLPENERAGRIDEWSRAVGAEPFDLNRPPLLRLDLFRLADERYRFVCRAHHLLFDGWSLAILLGDVLELYRRLVAGQTTGTHIRPSFRDYVAWLQKQDERSAEEFWQKTLSGFHSPTPIGFRPSADRQTYGKQESISARLAASEAARLRDWLRQQQLTVSTIVHGVWAVLLARHSGQPDVVFGSTVSGRPADLPGVGTIVGPFMNNVPLRVGFAAGQASLDRLKQVQNRLGQLSSYQHTPLVDIERTSELRGQARLFESLVVVENYPRMSPEVESQTGLRLSDLKGTATTVFPLSLVFYPEEMRFDLRYDTARFQPSDAATLVEEAREVLVTLSDRANEPVEQLIVGRSPRWDASSLTDPASSKLRGVATEYVAPRDAIERSLAAVWSDLTGREQVGVRDNFFELGGDSLTAVRLMAEVERQFGRKLPLVWLFQDPTIERLADVLRSGDQPAAALVPIRPRKAGSQPPLFCAHPAGGTVFCYRELARLLPDDQPVYGLQARGIDGREPPRARLEEMAADYVAEIRKLQAAGPYRLLGWSLGGLIVFEMARQLAAQGEQTSMVAIIDAGMIQPGETFDEDDFVPMLLQLFPDELRPTEDELKNLKPDEQLDFFRVRAERARLVAINDSPIEDQHVFQVFQANMTALLDYRPEPFSGKLTLFRARQDATPMHRQPFMGWGPWALGGVEEHRIEGEHVNLFREPYIGQLAAELAKVLGTLGGD